MHVAQVSGGAVAGDCAFGDSGDCGGVVGAIGDGGVGDIVVVSHEHHLSEEAAVFEVAVGDDTAAVVGGHELVLDFPREGEAPDVGEPPRAVVDAAHAGFGSVSVASEAGVFGHELRQVSRAMTEACGERHEGGEVVPEAGVDVDATGGRFVERELEGAEEAG